VNLTSSLPLNLQTVNDRTWGTICTHEGKLHLIYA